MTNTTHSADDILHEGQYIPGSYQFRAEYKETTSLQKREDFLRFSKEANTHFMAQSADDLVDTFQGREKLEKW